MKIVIDARFYGVEHTGIGRYVINLLDNLKDLNSENDYVVLLRRKYFDALEFPANWKKVCLDIPHYTIREQILLPLFLYKERPDVFHALQLNFPLFYFGKSIVTVHDLTQLKLDNNATTLPPTLYRLKHFAINVIFQRIKRVTKIIVPSQTIKNDLMKSGVKSSKIVTIYEGFDNRLKKQHQSIKTIKKYGLTGPYVIYVGNAYPHKNVKRAIDAVVHLNEVEDLSLSFAIVSARNNFTVELAKYVSAKKVSNYIKLLGYVPDSELGSLIHESKAFLYPSLAEGFGLPGLEALAVGTPLLASDIPVFKEIYQDSALYFDPKNIKSISDTLISVLNFSERERKLVLEKGRSQAEKYSWGKMVEETLKLYNNLP